MNDTTRFTPAPWRLLAGITALAALSALPDTARPASSETTAIHVDAAKVTGTVAPYIFGQNLEYEFGTFSGGEQNMNNAHGVHTGGIWAEMLRDRKFEQGDLDKNGVANAWEPEERLTQRYWELRGGEAAKHRYYIDTSVYYGGGAAQAIEVRDDRASVAQVGLTFQKGRQYQFYVYLKRQGHAAASVDFEDVKGRQFGHASFAALGADWVKFTAQFVAPDDTTAGRVRISVNGTGTVWIDSASLMPADAVRGLRRDVVAAMKPLRVPLLRYPGGCFADGYHWEDGIGPRDKRPERFDNFWNEWEPNDVGTDEFMDLAHELGADVEVTTNYLQATPAEAGRWVQYMNGTRDTPMGSVRTQNGHAAPYAVKIWAVGNESQQLCSSAYFTATSATDYVARYKAYAAAIKHADAGAQVMAVGAPPGPLKWNADVLGAIGGTDYLGVSLYTRRHPHADGTDPVDTVTTPIDEYDSRVRDPEDFYRQIVAEPADFAKLLNEVIASSAGRLPKSHAALAVTEFQAWWVSERNDADFRLANALYLGGVFHELMRHADQVAIAEVESLANVQGVIEVSQTSLKLTPEYYAYLLYRNHSGTKVLSTKTEAPMAGFNKSLPVLDSQATLSADGKTLFLAVINRSEQDTVRASVDLKRWAPAAQADVKMFELNGKDRDAFNPFGSSADVNITQKTARSAGAALAFNFAPHSVTVLEIPGRNE